MLDTKAVVAAIAPIIKEHTTEAVMTATAPLLERLKALEGMAPIKGDPGPAGRDGEDGQDAPPVSEEQIERAVSAWFEANPPAPGEKGADGSDGIDGRDGVDGERGADGIDGRDGVGLAGALIGRDGELNVTLSNGEVRNLGPVVGRDGENGKDGERGVDGFSLEDFDVSLKADGRTVELSFVRGDLAFTRELALPTMIYRGAYAEGQTYERGDTVTWGGSLWHCNGGEPQGEWSGATKEKPGEGAKAWTLAAKRGRDGKDGKGEKGDPGPAGRNGRDLTQVGPDGSKW